MKDNGSVYYTYELVRPDGIVFYVGKGKGNRLNDHVRQARQGVQSAKCDVIREIEASGSSIIVRKVHENLTSDEAQSEELALINKYGSEHLTNIQSTRQFKREPVRMGLWFNGLLLEQIEACMAQDGIEYSSLALQHYVREICDAAIEAHIQHLLK